MKAVCRRYAGKPLAAGGTGGYLCAARRAREKRSAPNPIAAVRGEGYGVNPLARRYASPLAGQAPCRRWHGRHQNNGRNFVRAEPQAWVKVTFGAVP